jgi:Ca-activated chloride channel homolog
MRNLLLLLLVPVVMMLSFINTISVTGVVRDANGTIIPFAVIKEKGTSNAVSADAYGKFTINVQGEKSILVVSAVGYTSFELKLRKQTKVDVVLQAVNQELQEVIVTGYAAPQKKDMAYSLQGSSAGITIRGSRTVNGNIVYGSTGVNNGFNTEDYDHISENGFHKATDDPLSTFSIDVDAASYSNVRRFINSGQLPPDGAVRIEELINYFHYDYPQPKGDDPFSINTELTNCPWNKDHKLVLIGLQGKRIPVEDLPASNLTFLIDVSGSMQDENKLPLVKSSLKMLVDQLREQDRIAIVVYAGNAGIVLNPTSGTNKTKIKEAIDNLEAGGSTAGGAGIKLAYKTARENFKEGGNNRVILCTDGDFNVGASSDDELETMIEKERESGVYLTVLGYGMGNYKDNKMQKLADKGNGNHAYIDGPSEAKKVLVNEFGGTLFTIAKDVKLQVEFNPDAVAGYRLIGYENRLLNKEDFKDDKKDAGELGSGHTVTALYEIIPAGVESPFLKDVDPLKYQSKQKQKAGGDELLTVKFRYKKPDGSKSILLENVVKNTVTPFESASENLRFASAVAEYGMLLRNSEFKGSSSYTKLLHIAKSATGKDAEGYRNEFISLVKKTAKLAKEDDEVAEN